MQKGERYCNIDYVVLMAILGIAVLRIVFMYDIACQWFKNLPKRMLEFPAAMRLREGTKVEAGIPSWHINGHGANCRSNFALANKEGVGRTCGEEVETTWAQSNQLGTSTREMGPGARHATLNDHWGGSNICKIVGFRECFTLCFCFVS